MLPVIGGQDAGSDDATIQMFYSQTFKFLNFAMVTGVTVWCSALEPHQIGAHAKSTDWNFFKIPNPNPGGCPCSIRACFWALKLIN